ncbi:receptor like protein 23-like [Cryptomeria japonica]|uniref:receptor like protein 23-like n=1 Tax=Cryptomeria japonica TaxID=3369 RepID=UPI0027D9D517|nr:receptor like protein 23-like [Cryptomeria japonica]
MESWGFAASPSDATNGGNFDAASSLDVTNGGNIDVVLVIHVDSSNESGKNYIYQFGGSFDIVMSIRRNTDDEMVNSLSIGTHSQNEGGFSLAWHSMAVEVEEGWITIKVLDLSWNSWSGNIPLFFGNMSSLTVLDLSWNWSGNIPLFFGNMSSLTRLYLSRNSLSANISLLFGNMSSLTRLDLSGNSLSGNIPLSFRNMSSLTKLLLHNNQLTGSMPSSLSNLSSLSRLDLSWNHLSGYIPESLGDLSSLDYLDLSSNQLNGTLPSSFSKFSSLTRLYAERSVFFRIASSELPLSLTTLSLTFNSRQMISEAFFHNLSKLEYLSLSNCVFNSSPTWIPSFQLKSLLMTSCKMNGQVPLWISTQFSLVDLQLADYNLVGEIPSWLLDMSLFSINLTANDLQGRLLLNTLAWEGIYVVDVSNNELCGQIPSIWPSNILVLLLNNNSLTGNIPPRLQDCSSMRVLNLANNHLNGIIPSSLANCSQLQVLNLGYKNLTGMMPSEIGQIPKSIGNFSKLRVLAMRSNNFEGSIPAEIEQLKYLQILDLSSNHLSGLIPHGIFSLQAILVEPHQELSMISIDYMDNLNFWHEIALDIDSRGTNAYYLYGYDYENGLHMNSKAWTTVRPNPEIAALELANSLAVLARGAVIALGIAVQEYQREKLGDCRSSASEKKGICIS